MTTLIKVSERFQNCAKSTLECNGGYSIVFTCRYRGESRISGKGVHMYNGEGFRFADFVQFS